MFKIFRYNGYLSEGVPYIIATFVRVNDEDVLEWFVLITKNDDTEECPVFTNRVRYCYKTQLKQKEGDFNPEELIRTQLQWAQGVLWGWLYNKRKDDFQYVTKADWEEVDASSLKVPWAIMGGVNSNMKKDIEYIIKVATCPELCVFLKNIPKLDIEIERDDENK